MAASSWKRETKLLLSSDSEGETETPSTSKGLAINKDYASRYEAWRGKEEIQKFKDKFGSASLEAGEHGSDSESSSESEVELANVANDKNFLKALSYLKKKDPIIYDGNLKFFPENDEGDISSQKDNLKKTPRKEKKPFLLKDHERKMILENGEIPEDEEQAVDVPVTIGYYEEQNNIKKGIRSATKHIESDSDDNNDDLLLKGRKKTTKEIEEEEEDYKKWLKGQVEKLEGPASKNDEKELKFLRDYWNDPKLDDGEQFLRDYILNKKYVEKPMEDYIPTYDEIVHDSDDGGLSGDESEVQKMEEFEQKYNFRFEEPDQEFIKKYPRTVENSIRRKENKRKEDRQRLREMRKKEKERKLGEIQQLKAFSRKQILEKIRLLQDSSGGARINFTEEDVAGDFDPDEYDNRTNQIFNDEFYSHCDDTEKPIFSDMEDDEDYMEDSFQEGNVTIKEEEPSDEEKLDADVGYTVKNGQKIKIEQFSDDEGNPNHRITKVAKRKIDDDDEPTYSNAKKKKGKKGKQFLETLEKEKQKLNPKDHSKLKEEYYKLDFEDLVGDIPCRFKYREVVPNDFGLTMEEILTAPDRELNRWSSIKKTYLYRSNEEELYDKQVYEVKRENVNKKRRLLTSLYGPGDEDEGDSWAEVEPKKEDTNANGVSKKKKKRKSKGVDSGNTPKTEPTGSSKSSATTVAASGGNKKKRKRKKNATSTSRENGSVPSATAVTTSASPSKKKNAKNKKNTGKPRPTPTPIPAKPDRLLAFGLNPKKYEKWVKYGTTSNSAVRK